MINELQPLSKTLDKMNIETAAWHREYKELPKVTAKSPCYRIWITDSGAIEGIRQLEPETAAKLRKYGNNQASFPAFNIKPLYRVTDEGRKREDNWIKSMSRIDKTLEVISNKFLDAIGGAQGCMSAAAVKLVPAAQALTKREFRTTLENFIKESIAQGDNSLIGILEYAGKDGKNPESDPGPNISVILDLAGLSDDEYPIASEKTTELINASLLRNDNMPDANSQHPVVRDAFGNPLSAETSEPMPEVKLSGFSVTLRAMFNGQPCQERYDRFDDASYPISKQARADAKGALEWIAKAENERVTWVKADKNEIAFAYPSQFPPVAMSFAAILGGIGAEKRFEDLSEEFLKAFTGLPHKDHPEYIRVFSIRKMDRARSKVVFTRNLTPDGYIKAAEEWKAGCRNIPPAASFGPITPFPLDAARIINTVWKRDGEKVGRKDGSPLVMRMQVYQGLELMLNAGAETASYLIRALVPNVFGLMSFAGANRIAQPSHPRSKNIGESASMLGLLLYKLGIRKEGYMKDAAFQIGQFLKASDELHALYGRIVRGAVPPQLVGSSMLTLASDAPEKALAQLCLRMDPYLTWAKSYRYQNKNEEGKESWRASWLVNLFERIAGQLNETLKGSVKFNDIDKAQLFLGYLASFPKREAAKGAESGEADDNVNADVNI